MANAAFVEKLRDQFDGLSGTKGRLLASQILDVAADDPFAVSCALALYAPFLEPNGRPHDWLQLAPADGHALLDRALAAADAILAGFATPESRTTADLGELFYRRSVVRALGRVIEMPAAEALAAVDAELAAAQAQYHAPGAPVTRLPYQLWLKVGARRSVWRLLQAGAPYAGEPRDQLINALGGRYGLSEVVDWPIAPLLADATFRAHVAAELQARSAARSHPAPTDEIRTVANQVASAPQADLHALRFALWLGADAALVSKVGTRLLTRSAPAELIDELLGLGLSLDAVDGEGHGLLHHAVLAGDDATVTRLVAAGAATESALALAKQRKNRAVIAAFGGKRAAPSEAELALATSLRAAAAALPPSDVELLGVPEIDANRDRIVALVERLLAQRPDSPEEALELASGTPYEKLVVASVLRAAGHRIDVKLDGDEVVDGVVASGDLVADGVLALEGGLSVAGDVVVRGLVAEHDVFVGGTLRASQFVLVHGNDGSLIAKRIETPLLIALDDHAVEGEEGAAEIVDDLSAIEDRLAKGVLADDELDIDKVHALVAKGKSIFKQPKRTKK